MYDVCLYVYAGSIGICTTIYVCMLYVDVCLYVYVGSTGICTTNVAMYVFMKYICKTIFFIYNIRALRLGRGAFCTIISFTFGASQGVG